MGVIFLVFYFEKQNHNITIVNEDRVDFFILKIFWQPGQRILDLKLAHSLKSQPFGSTRFQLFVKLLHAESCGDVRQSV